MNATVGVGLPPGYCLTSQAIGRTGLSAVTLRKYAKANDVRRIFVTRGLVVWNVDDLDRLAGVKGGVNDAAK